MNDQRTSKPVGDPPAKHLPNGNYRRADYFEAECERLRAELATWRDNYQTLLDVHVSVQAERARLREALDKYGIHKLDCELTHAANYGDWNGVAKCTCGLLAALQAPQ